MLAIPPFPLRTKIWYETTVAIEVTGVARHSMEAGKQRPQMKFLEVKWPREKRLGYSQVGDGLPVQASVMGDGELVDSCVAEKTACGRTSYVPFGLYRRLYHRCG